MDRKMLVQHNALTTARYEMSATEKNLTYMLLAQLGQNDPINKTYEVSLRDMEALTGSELKYKQVKEATEKLLSRVYHIAQGDNLLQVCMISSALHVKGSGKIIIRIDPGVRPYLCDLKSNFTKFGFYVVMSLKSKYAKRIYEMLSQFKDTGVMRISVEELKTRLRLVATKHSAEKYSSWAKFNDKVLKVAEQELREQGDLYFTYKAEKSGRKFTSLVFKIHKTSSLPKCIPANLRNSPTLSRAYERLIKDHKLSVWQTKKIIEHVPEQEIHRILYSIQLRIANDEIRNIGGFTVQTFENQYQLGLIGSKHPKTTSAAAYAS